MLPGRDGTCDLLPQQVIPLRIFEPRYKQMVEDVLDGTGQFAIAVFSGRRWKQEYHGKPPIRPAVCIGPGSIAQAHTKDEFISLQDLEQGAHFFRRWIDAAEKAAQEK